jgi:large subunit ribosomal protein L21
MFAVADIAGFQEILRKGDKLHVPHLAAEQGATVTFDKVFLIAKSDDDVMIGAPHIAGAAIEAKVLEHGRDEKIRIVKFKRRKRYLRVKGHRQHYTEIEVTGIRA